jgi:chemotaxis methyl-accepting protein methylase
MGQEAYSLAMIFFEAVTALPQSIEQGGWGGGRLKISASDICQRAMEKARQGRYKAHELRYLSEYYLKQYLEPVREGTQTVYQIIEKIRSAVQYGYLQLHNPETYWIQGQDIIFCQNVLIYFKPESRPDVVARLCRCLNPGGYLFLGPAEVVGLQLPGIQLIRLKDVLLYQRTG